MTAIHEIENEYGSIAESDHPLAMMLYTVIQGGEIYISLMTEPRLTPDRQRSQSIQSLLSLPWISASRLIISRNEPVHTVNRGTDY